MSVVEEIREEETVTVRNSTYRVRHRIVRDAETNEVRRVITLLTGPRGGTYYLHNVITENEQGEVGHHGVHHAFSVKDNRRMMHRGEPVQFQKQDYTVTHVEV